MKRILSIALAFCLCVSLCACSGNSDTDPMQTTSDDGYRLVFEDNFDGDALDRSKWRNEIGYIRNNEPQYYSDRTENVEVSDGSLKIKCFREDFVADDGTTAQYTSGSINTRYLNSWTYGKFEMRAKLPYTTCDACWPAFWTLGDNISSVNWPACGEIDILEWYGVGPHKYYTNIQWSDSITGEYNARHQDKWGGNGFYATMDDFGADWHTYGMIWDEEKIQFTFDGEVFDEFSIAQDGMDALHQPQFILLNLALTQEGGRTELDNGDILTYEIDYVRVYQKAD